MAFIRKRGGSHQLIESYREDGKVRQRVLANLGPTKTVADAIAHFTTQIGQAKRGEIKWSAEHLKEMKANLVALKRHYRESASADAQDDDDTEADEIDVNHPNYETAYPAVYDGPVNKDVVAAASATAKAWAELHQRLADQLAMKKGKTSKK